MTKLDVVALLLVASVACIDSPSGNEEGPLDDDSGAAAAARVVGTLKFRSISASDLRTCGIATVVQAAPITGVRTSEEIYCWGHGIKGGLGWGLFPGTDALGASLINVSRPTLPVGRPIGATTKWVSVSTGGFGACAVAKTDGILTSARSLYCWGDNGFGGLGLNLLPPGLSSGPNNNVPVLDSDSVTAMDSGYESACMITRQRDGPALRRRHVTTCWGANWFSQLGAGLRACTTPSRDAAPMPVRVRTGCAPDSDRSRDLLIHTVSVGYAHACGLGPGGLWCWGFNAHGELGDGTQTMRDTAIRISTAPPFTSISAGLYHTCGLTAQGEAFCWGIGGQAGDGTVTERLVPTRVQTGQRFVEIHAGAWHTCARTASTAAPNVYCWGGGGSLGNGSTADGLVPQPVAGNLVFSEISSGSEQTCGIANKNAYCWGHDRYGEVGVGKADTLVLVPSLVLPPPPPPATP